MMTEYQERQNVIRYQLEALDAQKRIVAEQNGNFTLVSLDRFHIDVITKPIKSVAQKIRVRLKLNTN